MQNDVWDDDHYDEDHNGYDGTRAPLDIAKLNCEHEPAVILGELRDDGLIIRAEGIGLLVVEKAPRD
jgi:hypothetical protein